MTPPHTGTTARPPRTEETGWRSSTALFDTLAPEYESHFEVAHRRLYDDLAWEHLLRLLPRPGVGPVIDAGCGTGRWARRLVGMGHRVIGIEPAPAMVAELRRRPVGEGFTLVEGRMEDTELPERKAAAVYAMGSLQFAQDPEAAIERLAGWVAPGGVLALLVDSLVALVLELIGAGKQEEALQRLRTRRGVWHTAGQAADLHLFDRDRLCLAVAATGLADVRAHGLLVSVGPLGREGLMRRVSDDAAGIGALEAELSDHPVLADTGKQLLVTARRGPLP